MNKLLSLIFLVSPLVVVAQSDNLGADAKWCEGNILHKDDTRMNGYILYNDQLGMIKFKRQLNSEEKSFSDGRILTMEYFDTDVFKLRKFASFHTTSEETGRDREVFFEIIFEFKEFAVLSRRERVSPPLGSRKGSGNPPTTNAKAGYEQFETVYIVGPDDKVEVLLFTSVFDKDKMTFHTATRPYVNRKLMMKHMGPRWKQVDSFAKDNKLKLLRKDDLLKALEYYEQLEKNGS